MQEQEKEEESQSRELGSSEKRGGYDELDFERERDFQGFNAYEENFTSNPTSNSSSKY